MKNLMLVCCFVLGASFNLWAQERARISATVETTTSNVVNTSSKSQSEFVTLYPTRWVTSEQLMTIEAKPTAKLSAFVKFSLAGSAENPAISLNPDNGAQYRAEGLRSYTGSNRHFETAAVYRLWKNVSMVGGYTRLSLQNSYEIMVPYGLPGSGLVTTYNEKETYSGIELGARSTFQFGNLGLEPGFLVYPKVSRNFLSHQNYLGQVFDNDMDLKEGRRMGMQLSGKAKYNLARHVATTFSYGYQYVRTTNSLQFGGPARENLKTRSVQVGLQFGF